MATIPASENVFPEVLLAEVAAPAAAPSGQVRLYVKADGLLYWKDDAGTEYAVGQGDTAAHLADTTDAHDASAISIADAGTYFTGTDVEAALQELGAAGGVGPTVDTEDFILSGADVTMVNANTDYDGPSGSFAAGTWLITATALVSVIVSTSQNYIWAMKVWDGSTIYAHSYVALPTAQNYNAIGAVMSASAIVTLGSPTTLKISCQCSRGSSASKIARTEPQFSISATNATRITGYRVF